MEPADEVQWWYEKASHARADYVASLLAKWLIEHEDNGYPRIYIIEEEE